MSLIRSQKAGWSLVISTACALLGSGCGSNPVPGSTPGPPGGSEPPPTTTLVWQWRALRPSTELNPEPRSHGVLIHDPIAERIVVFGGDSARGLLADVWAFDLVTLTWSELATRGGPPQPRLGANAVYDPNGHQLVLWAGQRGSRFLNDTWLLDLRSLEWREVSPAGRPQARYGSAAVFDPVERRLVQFAGFTNLSRRFQDTQAFDLDTNLWEDLTPADVKPIVRCLLTAALHVPSRQMLIYGGQQSGPLDDLWSFDLATRLWTELTPAERPQGRQLASSFVDAEGRFVVFGGDTVMGEVDETWAYDLTSGRWLLQEHAAAPAPRQAALAAATEGGERFFVFAGRGPGFLSDLWELRRVSVEG
jgi:hypothetical protein